MNAKTRKTIFVWLASLLVLIAALPINSAAAKGPITYDFNKSLLDWTIQTDDIRPAYSFELRYDVSPLGCAPIGCLPNGYANLKFRPSSAGAGAWLVVKVPTELDNGTKNVVVSFDAKNTGSCYACELVAYSSAQEPVKATQFLGAISPKDPQLNDNWQNYTFNTQVKTVANGSIYIALGLRSIPEMLGARSSGTGSVGLDNVSILVYPTEP